jgi:hypothetical protein
MTAYIKICIIQKQPQQHHFEEHILGPGQGVHGAYLQLQQTSDFKWKVLIILEIGVMCNVLLNTTAAFLRFHCSRNSITTSCSSTRGSRMTTTTSCAGWQF